MSKPSLQPLAQQVMVITGASSGIGLATALAASRQGARLVLAARSAATLDDVVRQIEAEGGQAVAVCADVSDRAQVESVAAAAIRHFGQIDTWVNDAGISIFGRLDEVSDKDSRRLFDINFWGLVHGSLVAVPHLKVRGGALINIGSEVSDAVFPLQGMYAASKHAVKGFTDALRIELEADEAPVSVTLVQPTAVDTPFPENAGNYLSQEPMLPSPMIEAEKVASAILDAATDAVRDVKVGAMSVINTTVSKLMPRIADTMAKLQMGRQQRNEVPHARDGRLYQPSESGRVRGRGDQNKADPDRARQTNIRRHAAVDGD
jgi:short-subunit dehydrogenase